MRTHIRLKGKVQGIGYRYFVLQKAKKSNLTGWVRNCSNGDVELEVQGDKIVVERFLEALEKGHPWASVEKMERQFRNEKENESDFEIVY